MSEEIRLLDRITVNATEAAVLLGVSRPTIYTYFRMEGFPVCRIGGKVLVPVEGLKAWIAARTGTGETAEVVND